MTVCDVKYTFFQCVSLKHRYEEKQKDERIWYDDIHIQSVRYTICDICYSAVR
jgi:hypothetical protein